MFLQYKSLPQVLEQTAQKYPNNVFLQIRGDNGYRKYTYKHTIAEVKSLASSISRFVHKGSKVAILSENRPEWCIAFFAASANGCILVPLDTSLSQENIKLFISHSKASLIFVSKSLVEKIRNLKNIRKICFDKVDGLYNFNDMVSKKADFDLGKIPSLDNVASIIYTSGTSGQPKGVMLTHSNFLNDLEAGKKRMNIYQSDCFICILPLYHVFAFTGILLSAASFGARIVFIRTLRKNEIFNAIRENGVTILFGVPKLFESIYEGLLEKVEQQTLNKRAIITMFTIANKISLKLIKKNFGRAIFKRIHEEVGESIRLMISGGAAINPDVIKGLYVFGFPIVEGYGLTETSPVVTLNDVKSQKFGSVGRPLDSVEVKISEKNEEGIGEILVKGPIVMKGYYKNNEATKKALKDGWLYTKDIGYMDEEGYLYIKGRKDNVIILSSGKNVYPDDVEHHYGMSPLIQEICVVAKRHGDENIVHALIVPDYDELKKRNIVDHKGAIKKEIEAFSAGFPSYKRILSFDIVSSEDLPKTSTLKFKKQEITQNIENKIKKMKDTSLQDFVLKVLQKYSDKKDFTMDSHLELDLKLDSLAVAEIISSIEDKLKISIKYDVNPSISTVQDLVNLVSTGFDTESTKKLDNAELNLEKDSQVPRRTDYDEASRQDRVEWLKGKLNVNVNYLLGKKVAADSLKGNIEHYIGMSQIPTGIAGPIKVNGQYAKGNFYVPLATTEGALVASVNRGMNIITKSGGANAKVLSEQLTKAPLFIFKNGEESIHFQEWVDEHIDEIRKEAESTTKFGKLIRIDKYMVGRRVILRLCYSCGDAMGANMITIATQKVCDFIKDNYKIEDYIFQSNLESEKKVSFLNFSAGRGKMAYADVVIKKEIVEKFLHTTVDRIVMVSQNISYGTLLSGMIGANAHIANPLTAIFIATGQDVAHVHDSSVGTTTIDKTKEGDLYVAVNLPSLAVGTVGGGTGIGTQKECLQILGCSGPGKVYKLAEIIAASVLAGEISLAGSQAAGDFALTHNKLGRNRPDEK